MKPIEKWDKIDELLNRGVDTIYPTREALEKVLRSGKKLKLYLGVDPSGKDLHLGHAVVLNKIRQFQYLNHKEIFLIGDFTGMIGDPSGKSETRKEQTREEVLANAREYKKQASKIVNFGGSNPAELKYNSEWLSKLTFLDFLEIATKLTLAQLLKRDMFQERTKARKDIYLHEFLYPVMQGYDSVLMDVDLEIGGSDQLFNMLVGRDLLKKMKNKEKFVLTMQLLTVAQGKKMGKTEGNAITIASLPEELYGQVMNMPDSAIVPCFEMITDIPMLAVQQMQQKLDREEVSPMELKKKLAWTLVKQYNDQKSADYAQEVFEKKYQSASRQKSRGDGRTSDFLKHLSEVAEEITLDKKVPLVNLITANLVGVSRSQAKRLIAQRAVQINGKTITNPIFTYVPNKGDIIQIGKHKILKITT